MKWVILILLIFFLVFLWVFTGYLLMQINDGRIAFLFVVDAFLTWYGMYIINQNV